MHSFRNLWYWIALAVMWSSASHWVMGVPWDMIARARRADSAVAYGDLETLARIKAERVLFIISETGVVMVGVLAFLFTAMLLLGFVYDFEFAQSVFLLALPMGLVGALSVRVARRINSEAPRGESLLHILTRHRLYTQIIGMVSITVTAMWGMYQNMPHIYFGG